LTATCDSTHTECVVVFPQQQWLDARATMVCVHCWTCYVL